MKFNLTKTLVALVCLLCAIGVSAHDFEVGGIYYKISPENNDEVYVTYYGDDSGNVPDEHRYKGNITIPEKVLYHGVSYSVTRIAFRAFYRCYYLTSITIPSSVIVISASAFELCLRLTSVIIPSSVIEIAVSAFEDCQRLTSVIISSGVAEIGRNAFTNCALTSVMIPSSVTTIDFAPFAGCDSLTEIIVESGNSVYDSRENCNAIIETATNTIIQGCENTVMPNSITTIGEGAFYWNSSFTSITIPNSVTVIEREAFWTCPYLEEIVLGSNILYIGENAFHGDDLKTKQDLKTVIIAAITPPRVFESTFTDYDATLIVPKGSVDVYKKHDVWGKFSVIVESENNDDNGDDNNDDNGDDNEDDNGDDDNSEDIEIGDIEITDVNRNWGMLRNDVIENQPYEYEMLDEDETSVIFTKSVDKSTAVFVSYKFDKDDCLCAATLSLPESVKAKEWLDEIFSEFKADIYVEDNLEVKKIDDDIITYDRSSYMDAGDFITVGFSYYEPMEERDDCVDLGLSVRWATMNLGAKSPEGVGNFYAFSETSTKSEYWRENYTYCNNNSDKYIFEYNNPLSNICGTQYDAARKKLGDGWKMPSMYEANELLTLCTWIKETVNGVQVYRVTGPNGNSIIIPIVGRKQQDDDYKTRLELAIGESPSKTSEYCYCITPIAGDLKVDTMFKAWGLNIRPVYTK